MEEEFSSDDEIPLAILYKVCTIFILNKYKSGVDCYRKLNVLRNASSVKLTLKLNLKLKMNLNLKLNLCVK
jgi:hypothetical protein